MVRHFNIFYRLGSALVLQAAKKNQHGASKESCCKEEASIGGSPNAPAMS